MQNLQKAINNGIDVTVYASDNGYVVIEPDNDTGNNVKAGSCKGKVVIKEWKRLLLMVCFWKNQRR